MYNTKYFGKKCGLNRTRKKQAFFILPGRFQIAITPEEMNIFQIGLFYLKVNESTILSMYETWPSDVSIILGEFQKTTFQRKTRKLLPRKVKI